MNRANEPGKWTGLSMRYLAAILILTFAATKSADAGAWLLAPEQGKLVLMQIEQTQAQDNIVHFRHRETYRAFLLEYGLTDYLAVSFKHGRKKRVEPQTIHNDADNRLGLLIDTPKLATGLLPPFVFQLSKKLLPRQNVRREKRASLTLGLHDERDAHWTGLALGDRISIGRFRFGQEVEFDRIKGAKTDWRNWLYRFSLAIGQIEMGSEAHRFVDYRGTYQALTHSFYMQWKPPRSAWQIRLKHGTRRAPMGQFKPQKNDYGAFEIERAF